MIRIIYTLFLLLLSLSGIAQSEYQQLLDYCNDKIAEEPDNAMHYRSRADTRKAMGDNTGARTDYEKVVELNEQTAVDDSTLADAHYELGEIHRENGVHGAAVAQYNKAIQARPAHARAHIGKAIAENARGRNAQACDAIREAKNHGGDVGNLENQFCP